MKTERNEIDTVVYHAGDATSAWLKSALDMLGQGAAMVALVGAAFALAWGGLGWYLGSQTDNPGRSMPRNRNPDAQVA
jgi:AAA family ATP:ADP antiporter